MKKSFWNALIWLLVLAGLFINLFLLLVTGRITFFLHPKMVKFVIFATVILGILTLYQLAILIKGRVSQQESRVRVGYFLFLIPIILMSFNPSQIKGSALANKAVNFKDLNVASQAQKDFVLEENQALPQENGQLSDSNQLSTEQQTTGQMTKVQEEKSQSSVEKEVSQPSADPAITPTIDEASKEKNVENKTVEPNPPVSQATEIESKEIQPAKEHEGDMPIESPTVVSDPNDTFLRTLTQLHEQTDQMLGKKVTLEGFVYRETHFSEDQFVVGRLLITCCAADAAVVGIMCQLSGSQSFKEDDWVRVSGVVNEVEIYSPYTEKNEKVFMMEVAKIERIDAYETPYIFFD